MIAANVAAARALEAKKAPVMYRVHEPPSREKLVALKDYLDDLRGRVRAGAGDQAGHIQPHHRAGRRRRRPRGDHGAVAADADAGALRARAARSFRARRSRPMRISPRRSAAMPTCSSIARWCSAYKLGDGGLPPGEEERFEQIGEQISMLERRAMEAERETIDRYVAAFLADQVGQLVECRITGVQPFGFFATVEDLGGDGLVLAKDLGPGIFPLRRGGASAGRRRDGRDLSRRPAADSAARRSQSCLRLTALRAARGQLWRRAPPATARPRTNARPPRPARQHPSQQSQAPLNFAMPPVETGVLDMAKTVALGRLRVGRCLRTDPDRRRGRLADLVAQKLTLKDRGRPEQLASRRRATRGGARQRSVLGCYSCHDEGLRGDMIFDEPNVATIWAPNLTHVAARATDEQLARAIRQGIGTDGRRCSSCHRKTFSQLNDRRSRR